ncbi:MAG: indolepyruvate ferredoxin oxidoreductase family protein, partial [Pseudomonadales bacterium]
PMSRSSSIQQQSEHVLAGLCIPVFSASSVQDIYDFGLIGWQLSRYAGVWVAIKMVSDIAESWFSIDVDPACAQTVIPTDYEITEPGVHIRWPDRSVNQDERMLTRRLPAVKAFVRANKLNRAVIDGPNRRVGIITAGKSYVDTIEALHDLGIDSEQAAAIGLSVYKVSLIWPLEPEGIREFAQGLDEVFVIEECRPFLEPQVKDALFNIPEAHRPRVIGKQNTEGDELFRSHAELTPALIARVLADWLAPHFQNDRASEWVNFLDKTEQQLALPRTSVERTPYFCSGCPHNSSTKVPEGSVQLAGIGCHWLVNLMDRNTISYPQMGGEGVTWVGAAPFVDMPHTFANVGDGTYYHSGSMAIRQAIAAKVNITYKILYNDAVAMTGGQPVDGPISVAHITQEMQGEGVKRIALVANDPSLHKLAEMAPGTTLHHRDDLETVQKELREFPGVSVLIYEQTCATELRRRRKRGKAADPDQRIVINDRVCEGCGDCGVQSNCLSVQPLETEFGRKRVIDQSGCNKDFSCVKGFCPSFVTVRGGSLVRGTGAETDDSIFANLPEPGVQPSESVYGILVAGIGGTGVVTISSLLGAAARIEGKVAQVLDLTGMAQKFGAVYCHLKIANEVEDLHATRLSYGKAGLLIGADIVTSGAEESLARLHEGYSHSVVNKHEIVTGAFTRDTEFHIPVEQTRQAIIDFCGDQNSTLFDSTELSRELTGDTIGANMMLLGYACQKGLLPVGREALEQAIEENGVAVAYNQKVFKLGRLLANDPEKIESIVAANHAPRAAEAISETLEQVIERRAEELVAYHDRAYADRYLKLVKQVKLAEQTRAPGMQGLTEAVARYYFKLLAYKDEYEVARLYTDGEFLNNLKEQFTGDYKLSFNLAPPMISKRNQATGHLIKREFGPWILKAFAILVRFKHLRGGKWDIFGYSQERKQERQLISDYEATIAELLPILQPENHSIAVQIATLPDQIRGYGHVKEQNIAKAKEQSERLTALYMSEHVIAVAA